MVVLHSLQIKMLEEDKQLFLEHGKPMIFGKEKDKGLVLNGLKLEVVTIGENGVTERIFWFTMPNVKTILCIKCLLNCNILWLPELSEVLKMLLLRKEKRCLMQRVKSKSKFSKVDDLFFSGETYEVK